MLFLEVGPGCVSISPAHDNATMMICLMLPGLCLIGKLYLGHFEVLADLIVEFPDLCSKK